MSEREIQILQDAITELKTEVGKLQTDVDWLKKIIMLDISLTTSLLIGFIIMLIKIILVK